MQRSQRGHERLRRVTALLAACLAATACGANGPQTSEPPERRPIIIDTDLDVSDVAAVAALVLDPSLDVRALTVAPTGTGVTNCAAGRSIAGYLLEQLGAPSVPYACGRTDPGPDGLPFPAEWRSAADTAWGIDIPPRPLGERPETAVDLLARAVAESPSPPTIVTLGPFTNLEDAFEADPSLVDRIAAIHAMAATVDAPGNVFVEGLDGDDRLEWNVAADPSAFVAVFETDVPLSLVPLDATDDVPARPQLVDRLADAGDVAGANLMYELMVRVPARTAGDQHLWDELAALALADPSLVTWEEISLTVSPEGRLDRAGDGRSVRAALGADLDATEAALVAALERGPDRPTPFAVSGEVAVTWDGSTCVTEVSDVELGMATLTFENATGALAAMGLGGITPPHTWDELRDIIANHPDTMQDAPPEWVTDAGFLVDISGEGGTLFGIAMLDQPGTYVAVCVVGDYPAYEFTPSEPFEIAP